jgi:hypothetical protein
MQNNLNLSVDEIKHVDDVFKTSKDIGVINLLRINIKLSTILISVFGKNGKKRFIQEGNMFKINKDIYCLETKKQVWLVHVKNNIKIRIQFNSK